VENKKNRRIKMLRKMVSMLLICLVMNMAVFANGNKESKLTEKVKSEVTKLGTGTDSKVKVKLKDGTKLKGYISEIKSDSFVVINEDGVSSEVPYPNAKQVKGNNLSTGVKIAIGIGLVFVAVGIICALSSECRGS
jgi:hypothetical protein